jgi:hypothetical protein
MPLKLNSTSGGSVTLQEPTTASNRTLTLPDATGTVVYENASGNVGIGTSSPDNKLHVSQASSDFQVRVTGTSAANAGAIRAYNAGGEASVFGTTGSSNTGYGANLGVLGTVTNIPQVFVTNNTERARIDSSGNLLVNKTVATFTTNGLAFTSAGNQLDVTSINDTIRAYRKTATGGSGVILTYSDVGGTNTLVGAGFANGTFGAVSDANKKKNVEDSRGYLNDLMQIRVVKYNWKTDEEGAPKELGWIAQEVEQVFPGMVNEMGGSKLLKKEVFLPMLLKAIQEQQAMIEELKAKVAALEAK